MIDKKEDSSKIKWSHMPWEALECGAQIISEGITKHNEPIGKPAWRQRPDAYERYSSALIRHMVELNKGNHYDKESGKHHIYHVLSNAIILSDLTLQQEQKNQIKNIPQREEKQIKKDQNPRLKQGEYFYLAHPWRLEKEIRPWQIGIQKRIKINLFNPLYDQDEEGIKELDLMVVKRENMTKEKAQRLTNRDKRLIRNERCKGVIAIVESGLDSFGTLMELFYNSDVLGKEAYCIVGSDYIKNHPWIVQYATKIFESKEEFEEFAKEQLVEKEEIATYKSNFGMQ